MISQSTLKPKPLASQKTRRRWVTAYVASFVLAILSIMINGSNFVEIDKLNNFSWISDTAGEFKKVLLLAYMI